jgi:acyl transferase domain-containing protein/acyl carrier protein
MASDDAKSLAYLRRVTEQLDAQTRRLDEVEQRRHEPIAIVGIGCRYPGGVRSAQDLWALVAASHDAIGEFPDNRGWDLERLYDPDPDNQGTSYTREGGFVADVAAFDAEFFGVSPREALAMDPQQRLMLEATWESLEHAGIDPAALRGSSTGVFTGLMYQDYASLLPRELEGYLGTAAGGSVVSGRISYTFGLEGPALTIDTACSSSLVALHQACDALRSRECDLALAGGVTVLSTPDVFVAFSRQRGLAPDGRCKSFSQAADGTGWGEGAGVLVLARLSDALRDGLRVLALVRGSAVNHDGASNGLTAPNGPSQERVIRQALASAQLSAGEVDVVEAHGTGTMLGDPIEAQALLATYGNGRERPLWLGSLKSNIGHTQAAAGVGGVIKMVMAMRYGLLPRTLHVEEPSSQIDWSDRALALLTEQVAWEGNGRPRRAGVSSFGISGTNAHVILEEAPAPATSPLVGDAESTVAIAVGEGLEPEGSDGGEASQLAGRVDLDDESAGAVAWLVSGRGEGVLAEQAGQLAEHLRSRPELGVGDVGFTLASGRAHFERRAAVIGAGREELLEGLDVLARGGASDVVLRGQAGHGGKVCFAFPGQGCQWVGMGVELAESQPVFARQLEACAKALAEHVDWALIDVLCGAEGAPSLERVDVLQPALFAVMVSLAELWRSHGVSPDLVIGHSQGEIAAAHVAGALSLNDAARVSALRARALAKLAGSGGMVAVSLPAQDLDALLGELEHDVSLAAVNSPASVVLSGSPDALKELLEHCHANEIRAKQIAVDYASHSAQVEAIRRELIDALTPITPIHSDIPLYSTLTGESIDTTELDAEYWYRSLRETVRFEHATRQAISDGTSAFVEITPHPVLALALAETLHATTSHPNSVPVIGTLRRNDGTTKRFTTALAQAHTHGIQIDWNVLYASHEPHRVELPTYPFERDHYWLQIPTTSGDPASAGQTPANHPLLAAKLSLAGDQGLIFTGRLSLKDHPWLKDHAVTGTPLLPASAHVELALTAARHLGDYEIQELNLRAPLVLSDQSAVQVQLAVSAPNEAGRREISIYSRPEQTAEEVQLEGEWTLNASGALGACGEQIPSDVQAFAAQSWPPEGAERADIGSLYEGLAGVGYEYGPAFQALQRAWRRGDELLGEVALDADQAAGAARFGVHPALLDAAFHLVVQAAFADQPDGAQVQLPFTYLGVRVYQSGVDAWRVRATRVDETTVALQALDLDGRPVISVDGVLARPLERGRLEPLAQRHNMLFELQWVASQGDSSGAPARVVAIGDTKIPTVEEHYTDLAALTEAIAKGTSTPDVVLVRWDPATHQTAGVELAACARAGAHRALDLLTTFLACEPFLRARLVFLTDRALASAAEEAPNLTQAPLAGLVRSAHSEHPDRFALIDTDGTPSSWASLPAALGSSDGEIALREGRLLVPRLARLAVERTERPSVPLDPERTILITGGTGALGALVARHMASAHGVRHLLLTSRQGPDADGAKDLVSELARIGCQAEVVACDIAQREEVAAMLGTVSGEHPLGGVIHAAGLLENSLIASLDHERLDRVLAPKLDGAIHLHELTAGLNLPMFVLFSSVASTWGGPGQGNYAAANAFLDALAQHRAANGLAANSIAWGLWNQQSKLAGELDEEQGKRLLNQIRAHLAMIPFSPEQGLELLDSARASSLPLLVAGHLDMGALRAQARAGMLPGLLRSLVRVPPRRRSELGGALASRLGEAPDTQREKIVLDVVRAEVAAVLGHRSGEAIEPDRAFKDMGFDSLSAVELRNRLAHVTALSLPATLVFDHPSCAAVAGYLRERIEGEKRAARVPARRAASEEPIAIVGMSCRYPGGVRSPQELWDLVASGTDAIAEFPTDRGWDLERLFDPDPDHPGTSYAREGGFIDDAGGFDGAFFSISPRDALTMDPQQRLMLEAAWEALESAGIDPHALRGSSTGVYTGMMTYDYGSGSASAQRDGFDTASFGGSVASGLVAYALGFEGPAITIDTACSSSLVALHQACQALRCGECDLALAGGVTVLSTPGMFLFFSRQRVLAPDGRCKPFAANANGVGLADGVGLVLVERLSDAQRAGHPVLAVVRGSAINQDGASNGLTAPNGPSQERVIRQALANAGLSAAEVDAVEAHGTGTPLGDPIEAQALLGTYGQERRNGPLRLGSVKSNIGHTQGAAGVAGVIKMVQAIRHETLPKSLHLDQPTRHVDWTEGQIKLLGEPEPWPTNGHPRRAGISAFGASGTNAHVIIEQAPARPDLPVIADDNEANPPLGTSALALVLSAKAETALRAQAHRLHAHLEEHPDLEPLDVAFTLASGRAAFAYRAVILGEDRAQLLSGLSALSHGERAPNVIESPAPASGAGRAAFVFPGQGAQWAGMAVELLDCSPVFAARLRECGEALSAYVEWPLEDVLRGDPGLPGLEHGDYAHSVPFAVAVALAGLWRACGVHPTAVIGHSGGEIAAAHIAGAISLQDAARMIVLRSRALEEGLHGKGRMAVVSAQADTLPARLEQWKGRIEIAAVNGPSSTVVSGDLDAMDELLNQFKAEDIHVRAVGGPLGAGHSHHVEPLRERLLDAFASVDARTGEVPFCSTVTGDFLDTSELNAEYWYRNARQTVQFARAARTLLEGGHRAFVEVSPHPVLAIALGESADRILEEPGSVALVGTLRRGDGGSRRFLCSLADLWVRGTEVDWATIFGGSGARRVPLPTYAFQRRRYWVQRDTTATADIAAAGQESPEHPLLGAAVQLAGSDRTLFTARLSLTSHPWLADHTIMGVVVLPASALVELVLHAGGQVECARLHTFTLEAPLVLPTQGGIQLQVSVGEPDQSAHREVTIYSRRERTDRAAGKADWTCNATGVLAPIEEQGASTIDDHNLPHEGGAPNVAWPPDGAERIDVDRLYDRLAVVGAEYGAAFQGLRGAWRHEGRLLAEVTLNEEQRTHASAFGVHPALLDGALHAALEDREWSETTNQGSSASGNGALWQPLVWSGVQIHHSGAAELRVILAPLSGGGFSLMASDDSSALVASVEAVRTRPLGEEQLLGPESTHHDSTYAIEWAPLQGSAGDATKSRPANNKRSMALIASSGTPLGRALTNAIGSTLAIHANLAALRQALDSGQPAPEVIWLEAHGADLPAGSAQPSSHDAAERDRDNARQATESAGNRPARLGADDPLATAMRMASTVHDQIQELLGDGRLEGTRFVFVTSNAAAGSKRAALQALAGAPARALVNRAQSEHVDRLALIEVDGSAASWRALPAALASAIEGREPHLALEEGATMAPRLTRIPFIANEPTASAHGSSKGSAGNTDPVVPATAGATFDPERTVLVTGGTGPFGALVARRLVSEHGVRHLLLASRRGAEAPGVNELERELIALGASVTVASCDVTDRELIATLIDSLPSAHPLGALVHAVRAPVESERNQSTWERLEPALAARIAGAWHLHELTEHLDLTAFVLFSGASGALADGGDESDAAGNAFLDALARHRRGSGLAGVSLAWGGWPQSSTKSQSHTTPVQSALRAGGVTVGELGEDEALELLDVACSHPHALLVRAEVSMPAVRAALAAGTLPPLLRGLIRARVRRGEVAGDRSLLRRLHEVAVEEREPIILQAVADEVADVLGYGPSEPIDPGTALRDLGFDSLSALELRNRLSSLFGLALPMTAVLEHPTSAALASYLRVQIGDMSSLPERHGDRVEELDTVHPSANGSTGELGRRFREACNDGSLAEFLSILPSASQACPSFTAPRESDGSEQLLPLSVGEGEPSLICLPSLLAMSGPHEYVQLAQAVAGERAVSSMVVPGFLEGAPLPATLDAAVTVMAEATQRECAGTPFALLGHSSGGLLAHALAARLERDAVLPTAVILIDTYPTDGQTSAAMLSQGVSMILSRSELNISVSDHRLAAMGAYMRLFAGWKPPRVTAPTLLLRATAPLPGVPLDGDWRATWHLAHTSLDIPGDHLTVMTTHISSTVKAITAWLVDRPASRCE